VVTGESTRPDLTGFDAIPTDYPNGGDAMDDSVKYDITATINKEQQDKLFRLVGNGVVGDLGDSQRRGTRRQFK
jgi:hypothetical protein